MVNFLDFWKFSIIIITERGKLSQGKEKSYFKTFAIKSVQRRISSKDMAIRKQENNKPSGPKVLFKTQNKLEKSQNYLDIANVMFLVLDVAGRVNLINKKGCEILGYQENEIVGKNWFDCFISKTISNEIKNYFLKSMTGEIAPVEFLESPVLTKSGEEKTIAWHKTIIRNEEGVIIGELGVGEDVTERKKSELALQKRKQELEQEVKTRTQELEQVYKQLKNAREQFYQAQKMESIGILAGGIAHDFNNLLATIIGNVSLAKMMIKPQDKIFNILTRAENICLRAKALTEQLLTFSRGGAPVKKIVSITKIIRDSVNIGLKGTKVSCEFALPGNIWPIEADEAQLLQVFNNLIINACQAMPEGGTIKVQVENLKLEANNHLKLPEGTYVKIQISDQGIGISEENLSKIFDPFFTTKPNGTGLGLTIAYSIIKKHNGTIQVTSQLGVGTIFQVYLPASHKEILVHRAKIENTKEISLGATIQSFKVELMPITNNRRILVMDDEEDVRATIKDILTHLGFEVCCAKNGEETIKIYHEAMKTNTQFSLVIMDLTIKGGMSGKATIAKLLKIDPKVKAIVVSGYANDPIIAEFANYGFCGALSKPFKLEELVKVLNKVLSVSRKDEQFASETLNRF